LLREAGLPEPAGQVDLGDDAGWIGRVDFVYRDALLVIECDGARYHSSLVDRRADQERDARLRALGWRVVRFTEDELRLRPNAVTDSVRRLLEREVA
jgi:very-short-patch-repair endonuclease